MTDERRLQDGVIIGSKRPITM